MDRFEIIIAVLDSILDTKRKRYIIGGILLSSSLFFGSLALTVIVLDRKEVK